MKRQLALAALTLITAAGLSGCTPKPPPVHTIDLAPITDGIRVVAKTHPQGGTLSETARGLADAIDNGTSIKAKLDRIAASDDPFGEALVIATCDGLTQIADQSRESDGNVIPPDAQTWEKYLNETVAVLLPKKSAGVISSRVSQFNNAAQLASIDPAMARVYVQQCALRKS
jgi:hypothetical protein